LAEVAIPTYPEGNKKGFAFVTFRDAASGEIAMALREPVRSAYLVVA
jgi:hypothetical protein